MEQEASRNASRCFLLGFLFDLEDGDDMFLQSVG
jgi:hypothetical protein